MEFGGYAKGFALFQNQAGNYTDSWTLTNPWAFKLSYVPRDFLSVNLAYVISPHWNSPAVVFDETGTTSPSRYRFRDFDQRLCPKAGNESEKPSLWHNLDRAYFRISAEWGDLYLGRQPIAWGSARFINPTDIIAPYGFQELDNEDRVGVDAFRMNIPLGQMSEIGLGYIAGHNFELPNSALYLRPKIYLLKTDLAVILIRFRGNTLYGVDAAKSLGGAGTWLEAGYAEFKETSQNAMRLSLGADYKLSDRVYAFGEYHYNGFGESNKSDYILNSPKSAYLENNVYLLAKHYLTFGINFQWTPLLNSVTQPILNLNDRSAIFNHQFEFNLTQNSYIACGFFKSIGEKDSSGSEVRSEFGSYPDIYFLSFRKYF